ncbi:MAG: autotransporter-associated beta strand repeat-containing protein [Planctomycetia bacterium]|nr:autotransporter-associated beta strand repeat-containing protein [Planctomycetia bacterium]
MSNGGKIIDTTTGKTGWAGNYGLDGDITVTAGTDNIISAEKLVMSARYTANPNKSNTFNVAKDAELTLDGNLLNPWTTIDTGARSLVKTGEGTLTLTGENNTYSGVTTVSAGTLVIDGTDNSATTIQYATSAVNVAGGTDNAKLVISGNENQSIIIPKVNVNNHGEIEFTSAGKKLTVDTDITVANDGLMRLTVPADLTAGLLIDGKLELESFDSLLIDISQIALDEEYELLTATGGIFVGDKTITDTLYFEQFLKDDTGVLNTFSVVSLANGGFGLAMNAGSEVPEPATWVLMILGCLGIFHISRNSQKKGAFQK